MFYNCKTYNINLWSQIVITIYYFYTFSKMNIYYINVYILYKCINPIEPIQFIINGEKLKNREIKKIGVIRAMIMINGILTKQIGIIILRVKNAEPVKDNSQIVYIIMISNIIYNELLDKRVI